MHQPHFHAGAAPAQGRARPGGTAQVALGFQPGGVQGVPSRAAHHTVGGQALLLLESLHGPLGSHAVAAVYCHGGQAAVKLGKVRQPELHLFHTAAGAAPPQGGARPTAGTLGAVGRLALAGQLGQVLDADVDICLLQQMQEEISAPAFVLLMWYF